MMRNPQDLPFIPSAFGQTLYEFGWQLVERHGVRLDRLVFDADELIWDWLMDFSHVVGHGHRFLLSRDLGHREFLRLKPGVIELIWGMHHASIEFGHDPWLRIWTNGYAWRIWKISTVLGGLDRLLGAPADTVCGPETFRDHPRLFCRQDYIDAVRPLVDHHTRSRALREMRPAAAGVLGRHFATRPADSSLKIPELATLKGKSGFVRSEVLIDDRPANVRRFLQTGRRGIIAHNPTPRILFGKLKNVVWNGVGTALERLSTATALQIGHALRDLFDGHAGPLVTVHSDEPVRDYPYTNFAIDIPDEILRREWVAPIQELKRLLNRNGTGR